MLCDFLPEGQGHTLYPMTDYHLSMTKSLRDTILKFICTVTFHLEIQGHIFSHKVIIWCTCQNQLGTVRKKIEDLKIAAATETLKEQSVIFSIW